jgi:hypothetical protein
LLAHAARFLATHGFGVVAIDFDLEAPSLHYKLGGWIPRLPTGGSVPYLIATADGAASPPGFDEHIASAPLREATKGWLRLMPAGPAPEQAYWTGLKELGERLRLGDPSGRGVMALLDLQARIAEELQPDYLLIDVRTGVTELGGLVTAILADTVVCLLASNLESLDGTRAVFEALKASPRLEGQQPVRIVPVLARADPTHHDFVARWAKSLKRGDEPIQFVLPEDSTLTHTELLGVEEKESFLYRAYLRLFEQLFPAGAKAARSELGRLEATAQIRESSTDNSGGA